MKVLNQVDLVNPENPNLSKPGAKREIDNIRRYEKVCIETTRDYFYVRNWLKGNNISFDEIRQEKTGEVGQGGKEAEGVAQPVVEKPVEVAKPAEPAKPESSTPTTLEKRRAALARARAAKKQKKETQHAA